MEKVTIKSMCNLFNVDIPNIFKGKENMELSRCVCKTFFVKKDSAFFCRGVLGNGQKASYTDSEKEARKAYQNGAICIVSTDQYYDTNGKELPCIIVKDPLNCFIELCIEYKKRVEAITVAITGSVGKTTTKEMMYLVAKQKYKTFSSGPTSNDFATISQIIQTLSKDNEVYIQEIGGFSPGFVEKCSKIVQPDVGVVTNIGLNHIDLYGSKEEILKDKICVASSLNKDGVAFLNLDDELLQKVKLDCNVIWYSSFNPDADFYADNIKYESDGISFNIRYKRNAVPIKLKTYGKHNVINAVVAFAFGKYLNLDDEVIANALNEYEGKGIRQHLCNIGGYKLFIDCYNVSPTTVVDSIKILNKIDNSKNNKVVILGDVARMGGLSENVHKEIARQVANEDINTYIMYGEYVEHTAKILKELGKEVYYTRNRLQLNQWITQLCSVGDNILICGHHESHLDKSIDNVWGTSFYFNDSDMVLQKGKDFENAEFVLRELDNLIQIMKCKSEAKEVIIPNNINQKSVVRIAENSFRRKLSLDTLVIEEGIYNIGEGAFYICTNLKNVKLPSTIKIIENNAFNYCKSIEEIECPDSLISIGRRAFYDCVSLKKITINKNVNYIGEEAFGNCKDLKIYCYKNTYAYKYAVENNIKYILVDERNR